MGARNGGFMKIEPIGKNIVGRKIEKFYHHMDGLRISEYLDLLEKPWKLIRINFIIGISRGLGFAIGTTIVFALILEALRRIVVINIPVINSYLVEMLKMIEVHK